MTYLAPYICIQGITDPKEVLAVYKGLDDSSEGAEARSRAPHLLMFAAHVRADLPDEPPPRFVSTEGTFEISKAVHAFGGKFAIHLASKEPRSYALQVLGAQELFTSDVFQLSVVHPDASSWWPESLVQRFRTPLPTVMQIGPRSLKVLSHNPKYVAIYAKSYGSLIDGIMIDASVGRGIPLDVDFTLACLEAIRDAVPDVELGISGGLDARSLPRILPIIRKFPHVSISAEGRLRTPDDKLDVVKAVAFIEKAYELFDSVL